MSSWSRVVSLKQGNKQSARLWQASSFTAETRLDKPGEKIFADAPLIVKGSKLKYVSRGGLKLEKALEQFDADVNGKIVLDIGSSTGGFTDCALQNGASHCYALDVGYNQLAWKIRQDPRVTVMERTNFRHATPELFTEGIPAICNNRCILHLIDAYPACFKTHYCGRWRCHGPCKASI